MPSLEDALDQLRAHDPARSLSPLSTGEREANRAQILAAEPLNATVRRSLWDALRLPWPYRTARRFDNRRWVVLGTSLVAAVVVAVLVGVSGGTGRGGMGHVRFSLAVPPAAAAELNKVAHAASVAPMPAARQWEYLAIKTEDTGTISTGGDLFTNKGATTLTYTDTQTEQTWYAPNGAARQRIANDDFSFATMQETGTYLAHKSTFDKSQPFVWNPTDPWARGVFEDHFFPSKGNSQPLWETAPVSDPKTLINEIWNEDLSAHGPTPPPWLLWQTLTYALLHSTSAQMRATAYKALAYVPRTKVLGRRTDQLGRSGIAISFTHLNAATNETLIVSPTTGDLLEMEDTMSHDADGLTAGTVASRELFLRRAVVDADTALPGNRTQPFHPAPKS